MINLPVNACRLARTYDVTCWSLVVGGDISIFQHHLHLLRWCHSYKILWWKMEGQPENLRENKFRMVFIDKCFTVKMFEELSLDPMRIYIDKNGLQHFVYIEYSFPLSLIENVDWFPLCSWIEAGEAATQLYWDTVADRSLSQCWCSRKTSEPDCRDLLYTLKHHHNLYFLSTLIQICMSSALNCEWLYLFLLTGSYGAAAFIINSIAKLSPWWAPVKI